jgi:hypothetical protein
VKIIEIESFKYSKSWSPDWIRGSIKKNKLRKKEEIKIET